MFNPTPTLGCPSLIFIAALDLETSLPLGSLVPSLPVMAVKTVSEFGRAREMFKYAASQVVDAKYQTRDALVDDSSLRAARDTVLTSIAELIALRLGAPRATISLFDENWQYVVAEATPRLPLAPGAKSADGEKLLLRGTAIPRSQSICSQVVTRNDHEASRVQGGQERDLPLFIIDDLSPRLENNPFFKDWPHSFYAGVPIQSPRGIDIGVLSIYSDHPGAELDAISQSLMQDASRTIMEYLIATRSRVGHRRADRMVRGVGSFVEGQASLSGVSNAPMPHPTNPRSSQADILPSSTWYSQKASLHSRPTTIHLLRKFANSRFVAVEG